jgi:hypothetical protein
MKDRLDQQHRQERQQQEQKPCPSPPFVMTPKVNWILHQSYPVAEGAQ